MTDYFIDGNTYTLWKTSVVQRSGGGTIFYGKFMYQGVDLIRTYSRPYLLLHQIESIQDQTPGHPDTFNVLVLLEPNIVSF